MEIKDLENKDQDFENDIKLINETICKFGVTMDELSGIHLNISENKSD